jgi:hypothetical protein
MVEGLNPGAGTMIENGQHFWGLASGYSIMVEHQLHHSKVEALSLAATAGIRSLASGDRTEV